jgi:hypothetical protein
LIDHAQVMAGDDDAATSITGGFSYGRRDDGHRVEPPAPPPRYPLPDHLLGPVGHLLAAFDEPTVIGVTVTLEKTEYDGEENWAAHASLASGEGVGGFGICLTQPLPQLLEDLAFGIQEHLSEQRSTWGQARPPCPGHLHPAVVWIHDGAAWWTCPLERTPLRPVVPTPRTIADAACGKNV